MSLGGVCLKSLQRKLILLVLIKSQGWSTSDTPPPWSCCMECKDDVGHKSVLDLKLVLRLASSIWGPNPQIMALPGSLCVLLWRANKAPGGAEPGIWVQKQRAVAPGACPTDTTEQSELLPTLLCDPDHLHHMGHGQKHSPYNVSPCHGPTSTYTPFWSF